MAKKKIKIKKENRGKFTAWAKRHGMSVPEAASHVMANKNKYSPSVVKMANFARNAAKWNKEDGGLLELGLPQLQHGFNPTIDPLAELANPYNRPQEGKSLDDYLAETRMAKLKAHLEKHGNAPDPSRPLRVDPVSYLSPENQEMARMIMGSRTRKHGGFIPDNLGLPMYQDGGSIYKIQPKNTLYSIAKDHGITVDELKRLNPKYANTDIVKIGDTLNVPELKTIKKGNVSKPKVDVELNMPIYDDEVYSEKIHKDKGWGKVYTNIKKKYGDKIRTAEIKYNLPENSLFALIAGESKGDPNAVSKTGAKGAFQFTTQAAKDYGLLGEGFDYRTDFDKSLDAGARYFSDLYQGKYSKEQNWNNITLTERLKRAYESYNWGQGAVKHHYKGTKDKYAVMRDETKEYGPKMFQHLYAVSGKSPEKIMDDYQTKNIIREGRYEIGITDYDKSSVTSGIEKTQPLYQGVPNFQPQPMEFRGGGYLPNNLGLPQYQDGKTLGQLEAKGMNLLDFEMGFEEMEAINKIKEMCPTGDKRCLGVAMDAMDINMRGKGLDVPTSWETREQLGWGTKNPPDASWHIHGRAVEMGGDAIWSGIPMTGETLKGEFKGKKRWKDLPIEKRAEILRSIPLNSIIGFGSTYNAEATKTSMNRKQGRFPNRHSTSSISWNEEGFPVVYDYTGYRVLDPRDDNLDIVNITSLPQYKHLTRDYVETHVGNQEYLRSNPEGGFSSYGYNVDKETMWKDDPYDDINDEQMGDFLSELSAQKDWFTSYFNIDPEDYDRYARMLGAIALNETKGGAHWLHDQQKRMSSLQEVGSTQGLTQLNLRNIKGKIRGKDGKMIYNPMGQIARREFDIKEEADLYDPRKNAVASMLYMIDVVRNSKKAHERGLKYSKENPGERTYKYGSTAFKGSGIGGSKFNTEEAGWVELPINPFTPKEKHAEEVTEVLNNHAGTKDRYKAKYNSKGELVINKKTYGNNALMTEEERVFHYWQNPKVLSLGDASGKEGNNYVSKGVQNYKAVKVSAVAGHPSKFHEEKQRVKNKQEKSTGVSPHLKIVPTEFKHGGIPIQNVLTTPQQRAMGAQGVDLSQGALQFNMGEGTHNFTMDRPNLQPMDIASYRDGKMVDYYPNVQPGSGNYTLRGDTVIEGMPGSLGLPQFQDGFVFQKAQGYDELANQFSGLNTSNASTSPLSFSEKLGQSGVQGGLQAAQTIGMAMPGLVSDQPNQQVQKHSEYYTQDSKQMKQADRLGKASAGLATAATAAQAIPVYGQLAGAVLGVASGITGMIGKRKAATAYDMTGIPNQADQYGTFIAKDGMRLGLPNFNLGGDMIQYDAPPHSMGGQNIDANGYPTDDPSKAVANIEKDEVKVKIPGTNKDYIVSDDEELMEYVSDEFKKQYGIT